MYKNLAFLLFLMGFVSFGQNTKPVSTDQNETMLQKPVQQNQNNIIRQATNVDFITNQSPQGFRNTKSVNTFYCYVGNSGTATINQGLATSYRNTPSILTSLVAVDDPASVFGGTYYNGKYYGMNSADNSIAEINLTNGAITSAANPLFGVGEIATSISYDPISDLFYISTWDYLDHSFLYKYDLGTNTTTFIDTLIGPILFSISFDDSGNLFGIDVNTEHLVTINPADASWDSLQYPLGFNANFIQDLEWDYYSSQMYYAAYNYDIGTGQLYIADITTGKVSYIGDFPESADVTGLMIPPADVSSLECKPGSIYSQAPVDFLSGFTSNSHSTYTCAHLIENYTNPVEAVRFFGVQGFYDSGTGWAAVNDDDSLEFTISFLNDDGGIPGSSILYTETAVLTKNPTDSMLMGMWDVFYWDFNLSSSLTWLPEDFYVAISNSDSTTWFLWIDKSYGMGTGMQLNVTWGTISPLGICLVAETASIDDSNFQNTISIYPNPSNGLFNINVESNCEAIITDITGRTILKKQLTTGSNTIEITSQGIYFIHIDDACSKIIVQ